MGCLCTMTEKIEYEIEISAKSSAEIRKLLSDIDEGHKKVNNAKVKFESQGAPIQGEHKEPITILSGEQEDYAFPDKSRDRTSKQAIQRNNQFKELQKKVKKIEDSQESQAGEMLKSGGMSFLQGGNVVAIGQQFLLKLAPVIGPLFIAWGIVDVWIDYLFKDGGPFDRRYKRSITTEIANLTSRQLKGQLRQGYAEVRVTAIPNLRGGNNLSFTNLSVVNKGGVYSENAEMLGKGL